MTAPFSPLLDDNEVECARYNFETKKSHPFKVELLESGCAPLFKRTFFPWGSLPYPKEHAELGALLYQLGEEESAHKMGAWHEQLLDHYRRPFFSFFNQERSCTYTALEEAVLALLQCVPRVEIEPIFVDKELGVVRILDDEESFLFVGSGCKSGMGAHLFRDVGIINYGPQLLPVGTCQGFGIAGRVIDFSFNENKISYRARLAAPHPRKTLFGLEDSGYSGLWMYVEQSRNETVCTFDGFRPLNTCAFSFFLKAPACYIAGSHKLSPRSLDRYRGPPSAITLQGGMELDVVEGATEMEVIPLAGDESFWGADFLASFTLASPFRFRTQAKKTL